jgi:hypothetical protein
MPAVNASTVVFVKDIYEQAGRADETLRYCGASKFCAAMVLKGNWHMRPNLPSITVFTGQPFGAISQTERFT